MVYSSDSKVTCYCKFCLDLYFPLLLYGVVSALNYVHLDVENLSVPWQIPPKKEARECNQASSLVLQVLYNYMGGYNIFHTLTENYNITLSVTALWILFHLSQKVVEFCSLHVGLFMGLYIY